MTCLVVFLCLLLNPTCLSADDFQSAGVAIALGDTQIAIEILSKIAEHGDVRVQAALAALYYVSVRLV